MIGARLRRLHRGQRGLSAVEMIVTMALFGIIMGAIFSVYLLLYRVQTTWQDKSQARATGLVAEQSLQRDLERYRFASKTTNKLVLSAAGDSTFSVTYERDTSSRVVRTVTQGGYVSKSVIAHGILELEASCSSDSPPSPSPVPSTGVWVDPLLTVTMRNDPSCGALSVALRVDTQ